MPSSSQLARLYANLAALGMRKLMVLGVVGLAVALTVGFGSYYLSKPDMETLYSGLNAQDVSRVGAALADAGIAFDVSADGTKVLVEPVKAAEARVLLAEKGLPASATAGYELFDKIGSMGLTSFMQEVTRVRALEGELSRTIQTVRGVKAARVHIVMPDATSFRHERQKPSASVVVRPEAPNEFGSARAIRHLVAAAIPGMSIEQVQVVSTDGTVLSAEADTAGEAPTKLLEIERAVSQELQNKVRKTLTPYLGNENFELSIAAKVNMDKRQTNETAYDPKSRVERSLRVVKDQGNQQNTTNKASVSVEQNLPGEDQQQAGGDVSKKSNERREELTNYEISTKQTQVESQGFKVEQVSVAILVNRKRVLAAVGAQAAPAEIDARLKEVEALVRSAAGLDKNRGDEVTVAAVDFLETPGLQPTEEAGATSILLSQAGSLIRALTILGVAGLLIMFGIRPVTRALQQQAAQGEANLLGADGEGDVTPALTGPGAQAQANGNMTGGAALMPGQEFPSLAPPSPEEESLLAELARSSGRSATKQLETIVNHDEKQAAAVLKQWLQTSRAA